MALGSLLIGTSISTDPALGSITGLTTNQVLVSYGSGNIILSLPQDINTFSTPIFGSLTLSSASTPLTFSGYSDGDSQFPYISSTGVFKTKNATTLGQFLSYSNINGVVLTTIQGTTSEITVGNNLNGMITLSTPQPIATTSSVTFASITDSGLTNHAITLSGTGGLLKSAAVLNNGQLLIGAGSSADPVAATLTQNSANQVIITNGGGTIELSLPQDIATISTPNFQGLNINYQGQIISSKTSFNFSITNAATVNTPSIARVDSTVYIVKVTAVFQCGTSGTITLYAGYDVGYLVSFDGSGTLTNAGSLYYNFYNVGGSTGGDLTIIPGSATGLLYVTFTSSTSTVCSVTGYVEYVGGY